MPKQPKRWMYSPRSGAKPTIPEVLKQEVTDKANELIETVLKPMHILPPPEDPQFNYIADIYGKWYRNSFYFCAKYIVAGPNPTVPDFEVKFTRMMYAGDNRFNLAYMRYTEQWQEIYTDLTLDECLDSIQNEPFFQP